MTVSAPAPATDEAEGSSEPSAVPVYEEEVPAAVAEPWILAVTVTLPVLLSPVEVSVEEAVEGAWWEVSVDCWARSVLGCCEA